MTRRRRDWDRVAQATAPRAPIFVDAPNEQRRVLAAWIVIAAIAGLLVGLFLGDSLCNASGHWRESSDEATTQYEHSTFQE